MKLKKQEPGLSRGLLYKPIAMFAISMALSGIMQLLYNTTNLIIVGKFEGSDCVAAIGATASLINLIINIFVSLSVGISYNVARCFGSKDFPGVSRTAHTAIALGLSLGVVLSFLGIFITEPLLRAMGTPADILPKSALYMRVYFISMPALLIFNFGSSILRAAGDTKRPLYILVFSGLLNVLFNLLFVIGFKMSVVGVATATVIAQVTSALLVMWCLVHSQGCYRIFPKNIKIHRPELAKMIKVGIPAGIQGSFFSLSNVLIQSSVNSFGSAVVAGNSAASSLEGFAYSSMNSLHHAALIFTSQNYGARNYRNIKKTLWICTMYVTAVGLVLGWFFILFRYTLIGFFMTGNSTQALETGAFRLIFMCSLYFLCGLMEVFVGVLRGLGRSITPMLVSLAGACGLRIVWVYTIFAANKELSTLYISYPVSWAITAAILAMCLWPAMRKTKMEMLE